MRAADPSRLAVLLVGRMHRIYHRGHLAPRMKLIVRRLEPGLEDVSVDLRG